MLIFQKIYVYFIYNCILNCFINLCQGPCNTKPPFKEYVLFMCTLVTTPWIGSCLTFDPRAGDQYSHNIGLCCRQGGGAVLRLRQRRETVN